MEFTETPVIIFEGPDGAGKTTLMKKIQGFLDHLEVPHEIAPRFATSEGGPMINLGERVAIDYGLVRHTKPHKVRLYDRHPLISDYIYGPILRGGVDESLQQLSSSLKQDLHLHALVVVVQPPLSVCQERLKAEPQLDGVVRNYEQVWNEYSGSRKFTENGIPKATNIENYWYKVCRYTSDQDYLWLCESILKHISEGIEYYAS